MWFDLHYYLPDDILVQVDRMSMAHALEVRCPYLDQRVAEMAFNLPPDLKIKRTTTKVLLRKIAAKRVPAAVIRQKKQGFMVPLEIWFRDELKALLEDQVLRNPIYEGAAAGRLFDEHRARRADHSAKLWLLLVFALFLKRTF